MSICWKSVLFLFQLANTDLLNVPGLPPTFVYTHTHKLDSKLEKYPTRDLPWCLFVLHKHKLKIRKNSIFPNWVLIINLCVNVIKLMTIWVILARHLPIKVVMIRNTDDAHHWGQSLHWAVDLSSWQKQWSEIRHSNSTVLHFFLLISECNLPKSWESLCRIL